MRALSVFVALLATVGCNSREDLERKQMQRRVNAEMEKERQRALVTVRELQKFLEEEEKERAMKENQDRAPKLRPPEPKP